MNNYFFKYNSKKDIVIYDSNGKIISEGESVFNAFDLMTLDIIKNVVINGNDLIIHYDSSSVTFVDYSKIYIDSRYKYIKDYIAPYTVASTKENINNAKKVIKDKKTKSNEQEKINDNKLPKKKSKVGSFIKRVSITGAAVATFVFLVPYVNEYYKTEEDTHLTYERTITQIDESSTRKNDLAADRYSLITKKYTKKFGIDGELVIAILTNNMEESSMYVDEKYFGAIYREFDEYIGKELSYYDFETENWSNYRVTEDDMLDSDRFVKVIFMILQSKIYFCNYNVVAGIQCLHEDIYDFKDRIMADGREKHPDYAEKSYFNKEYFNYAMSNTDDISWIDNFKSPDGSIYSIKVLRHIPTGTNIKIKHPDGEITNYPLNIYYSMGQVLK